MGFLVFWFCFFEDVGDSPVLCTAYLECGIIILVGVFQQNLLAVKTRGECYCIFCKLYKNTLVNIVIFV